MRRIGTHSIAGCLWLLFTTSTCIAQMYTVTDLGTLGGSWSEASGINASGQVVGTSQSIDPTWGPLTHAFRTAPVSAINAGTDDLNTVPCTNPGGSDVCTAWASGVNDSGQVSGFAYNMPDHDAHAFRTEAQRPIANPQDAILPVNSGGFFESQGRGLNNSGQVVGWGDCCPSWGTTGFGAFSTAANSPLTAYNIGGGIANGINDSGQAVGSSGGLHGNPVGHAFRTAPNSPNNPATYDLGTLGGTSSSANGINSFGEVVGWSGTSGDAASHAFRTAPNAPINPATDDLGTLGGSSSSATGIDNFGQVVGWASLAGDTVQHAFLYSGGGMHDLNNLIPTGSNCPLVGTERATAGFSDSPNINDAGQIAANVNCSGQYHAVRLDPIYKAFVQQPINADGSSVFSVRRKVIPVKFALSQFDLPTCTLSPATIAVTRATSNTLVSVDVGDPDFRISGCRYHYNLDGCSLGVGTYRVDINFDQIMVGHAVFTIKQYRK